MTVAAQAEQVKTAPTLAVRNDDASVTVRTLPGLTYPQIGRHAGGEDVSTFGSRLKAARIRKGKTQREVAEQIGLTKQSIAAWERGIGPDRLKLNPGEMKPLADYLDLDVEWLISGPGERAASEKAASSPETDEIRARLTEIKRNLRAVERTVEDIVRDIEDLTE